MTGGVVTSSSQPLPPKEMALFKKILKCYEQRQYKVGLRCAKQILSNSSFSEHGETLAMKGLILNCLGKREEALEIVKKGLTSDIRSHICWHVFGLVQRSEKKYDEAVKAYKMALKIEPENLQILRDLSLLLIQMRDYDGYRDTRYKLLLLRPSNKLNWIAYANAHHLLKEYDIALGIIREFKKNNRPSTQFDMENSELVLYETMILSEFGKNEYALTKLEENSACIIDNLKYFEVRALLLMELSRFDDAEDVYWILIERNPENIYYYRQIEQCRGLSRDEDLLTFYTEVIERYPKASVPKIMELCFAQGEEFDVKIRQYLSNALRKCIPSLFKNLALIYDNQSKRNIIERILLGLVRKIEESGYNKLSLDGSNLPECPTTALWIYYYLAQHFDKLHNYERAHKFIDEALKHTPTLIELYMMKAKIFKHEKDFEKAANLMIQAQELDTADRYLNSKCAKYLLHAGKIAEAEQMCSKFTRENANASESLNDMQCMWYELHSAFAYYSLGQYGEALKKCHQIDRHFMNFYEDQYDFHSYCIRKMTLSSYTKILRYEDMIRGHKYYLRATKLALRIYLEMFENPEKFEEREFEGAENMSKSEIRKMRRKANKEKAVLEKNKPFQNGQIKNGPQKKMADGDAENVDTAPLDPQKLAKTADPIGEAQKFVQSLFYVPCNDLEFFILSFKVYYHRNKILAMLKCLNRIYSIDPFYDELKSLFSQFLEKYKSLSVSSSINTVVDDLVLEITQKIST